MRGLQKYADDHMSSELSWKPSVENTSRMTNLVTRPQTCTQHPLTKLQLSRDQLVSNSDQSARMRHQRVPKEYPNSIY